MRKRKTGIRAAACVLAGMLTVLAGCGSVIGGADKKTGIRVGSGASAGTSSEAVSGSISSESSGTGTAILADGTYTPDAFGWSGGSGKAVFSIGDVEVRDGTAYATLTVHSSHYQYYTVDGKKYDTSHGEDTSYAEIPVKINQIFEVSGYTTAMSEGHDIQYEMYVGFKNVGSGMTGTDGIDNWQGQSVQTDASPSADASASGPVDTGRPPAIDGLTYESQMELDDATCFDVFYYKDGYKVIDVYGSAEYLLVPEGKKAPAGLPDDVIVLQQPLDRIYLAATSAMSLFDAIDSLDAIRLTGTDENGWDIEAPKTALKAGKMLFAGKYSEPDYELLVSEGCDLAIESTMILHTPEVQEMIEKLGIPVFIDRSSYEKTALGRTEWIRLYGAMMNKEEEADRFFESERQKVQKLSGFKNTGKTVAFFSLTTSGTVTVRTSDDYIPDMIEKGGAKYIFSDLKNTENHSATVEISMEQFYSTAVDADYLIYNATIEDKLRSVDELVDRDSVFADFKAVKEGNVWQVDRSMYQSTDIVGRFITDVNIMVTGGSSKDLTFLSKVE